MSAVAHLHLASYLRRCGTSLILRAANKLERPAISGSCVSGFRLSPGTDPGQRTPPPGVGARSAAEAGPFVRGVLRGGLCNCGSIAMRIVTNDIESDGRERFVSRRLIARELPVGFCAELLARILRLSLRSMNL